MYAMLLEGVLKEKIWGGNHLSVYNKNVGDKKIGESWEVACHDAGNSRIRNGRYKGLSLGDLMTDTTHHIFLKEMHHFPLLVKYIDANDDLSLQVHPNDTYSHKMHQPFGKTEAWYIIEAEEGAEIILGTLDTYIESLNAHIDNFEEIYYTNHIRVRPGELYFVPAGTIHAIGKGIVLLEIQQNSDTTFRIFDYDRGRQLHLKEAKEVVDLNSGYKKCSGETIIHNDYEMTTFIETKAFTIERLVIKNHYIEAEHVHDFQLISCVEGNGMIIHEEGMTPFVKGDSILIPADLKHYEVYGYATLIRTYISE